MTSPINLPTTHLSAHRPLRDEEEFTKTMALMVADEAPRLFAIVQEFGSRNDGRIAAWGMEFVDYTEVVSVEGTTRARVATPAEALPLFQTTGRVRVHLVWRNKHRKKAR